jgi:hypothetical protein
MPQVSIFRIDIAYTVSLPPPPNVLIAPNWVIAVSAVAFASTVSMNGQERPTIASNIPPISSLWWPWGVFDAS